MLASACAMYVYNCCWRASQSLQHGPPCTRYNNVHSSSDLKYTCSLYCAKLFGVREWMALEGCRGEEKTLFSKSFWLIYRQCSCVLCILYALLLFLLISGGLGLGGETECEHAHVTADDVAESSF